MKTVNSSFLARTGSVERKWYVIDATDKVLGRLAIRLAAVLTGKHKPTYTPHVDTGDFVIVLNAGKVKVTGSKKDDVVFQRYTRYPGGRKEFPMRSVLETHPERVLYETVRRMMPKNKLARHQLAKLKLFAGDQHPHQAQMPEPLPFPS